MIGIGIIGLGTVGTGTYKILKEHFALIKHRTGLHIEVVKIADIDLKRRKGLTIEKGIFTSNALDVINDRKVHIVVELIGGINPAYDYILSAIKQGKWIVTANKALLAEKWDKLFNVAARHNCEIGFEASVCGGIPVIRAIREGLVGNRILYILGILNGTSNYILSRMTDEGMSFNDALQEAQRLGIAEQDPTLDIEGIDAVHKLCILTRLAFHSPIKVNDIIRDGISRIEPIDIGFAKEFGYKIKLLAVAKERNDTIEARVEPAMLPVDHPMSNVNGVYNATYVVGDMTGPNLYYGKGAGAEPTGSAVVSDIVDMALRMREGRKTPIISVSMVEKKIRSGEESRVPYYIRFNAQDRPGVLSKISGILAKYNISISAVIQKGRKESGHVPIVMLTHEAIEKNLKQAKREINKLPVIKGESVHIRIEEGML
ncbi:MAG TPA: homoserine dehydrogenase [Deltaproteobacteria bacterium]|nr:homoserine dehydrogenase [Deltaproteobacteria bacterium]